MRMRQRKKSTRAFIQVILQQSGAQGHDLHRHHPKACYDIPDFYDARHGPAKSFFAKAAVPKVKVPATRMLASLVQERFEDVKTRILVPSGVAARSSDQIDEAAQILRTLKSDVQHCLASPHHSFRFDSEDRTCRVTSWAPADNIRYNEPPAVSEGVQHAIVLTTM